MSPRRRRRRKARSPLPAGVALLGSGTAASWVWTKVDHWALLAVAVAAAAGGLIVWTWVVRRRKRCWLYEYDHATLPGRRYIGITYDHRDRHKKHQRSWWYASSTQQMRLVKVFPNRAQADAAETQRIMQAALAGEPLANDRKVPRHIRQARIDAGHLTRGWSSV